MPLIMFVSSSFNTYVNLPKKNVVSSFFQTRRMLKEMNATSISLIPKVANPMRLIDFRPISCCNTVYKCIAKILAERIKAVLPSLVGPYQTTFISG